ncbi:MAG: B12-binding domain-containing radical SAM protein [Candidatus Brocadiaceae bacterium]|nr:B12-binding domain-containing radical SAM protein [Candidatus Brocadiaceae bacterium]
MKIFLIHPKAEGSFRMPPLGLQIIATVLKEHGYESIYDIDPNKGDDPYGLDYSGKDVLVGITVTYMTVLEVSRLAEWIKNKNREATIILGGPQTTLEPEESIHNKNVDVVVIGEGHETILEIAGRMSEKKTLEGIKGVWYKNEKKEIIKNRPRNFTKNLDTIPYIDRSFFHERDYVRHQGTFLEKWFVPVTWYMMTAFSCPYNCNMCQPGLRKIAGPWRQRSVAHVIREIQFLKEKYHAKVISFYDNDMGINKEWLKEFCRETKKIKGIVLKCCGRANLLDYEMLKIMKEGGFHSITVGAESGSDRVLKDIMNKKTAVRDIIDIARNCYKLKIRLGTFWMLANPGETLEEMKETIALASELPVFYAHFHLAVPNPGTQYYLDALQGGYLKLSSWNDVSDRRHPAIIKDGVTVDDIMNIDEYLITTMVKKGWNYTYNPPTLSFFNTRRFLRWFPLLVFGNEMNMFLRDFKFYHFRNVYLGLLYWLNPKEAEM